VSGYEVRFYRLVKPTGEPTTKKQASDGSTARSISSSPRCSSEIRASPSPNPCLMSVCEAGVRVSNAVHAHHGTFYFPKQTEKIFIGHSISKAGPPDSISLPPIYLLSAIQKASLLVLGNHRSSGPGRGGDRITTASPFILLLVPGMMRHASSFTSACLDETSYPKSRLSRHSSIEPSPGVGN
jgi:hypothetical protein